jgi:hypothetical protein
MVCRDSSPILAPRTGCSGFNVLPRRWNFFWGSKRSALAGRQRRGYKTAYQQFG